MDAGEGRGNAAYLLLVYDRGVGGSDKLLCIAVLGMEATEMSDTPPTAGSLLTMIMFMVAMFRVVCLEYLPVVRASLATRQMMLLLWQHTVDIMRSGAYMRLCDRHTRSSDQIGQGAEASR